MVEPSAGYVSPDDPTRDARSGEKMLTPSEAPTASGPLSAPPPPPPSEGAGTRFGRYLLRAELGRGGFGIVHEAWDTQLGRTVALKRILPRPGEDDRAAGRQVREARAAARLRHPSIVTVYDVGEEGGCPYFTMERVEGRSLEEHLRARDAWTTLPMRRRVEIAAQVGEALGYAHSQGIVHRDVKASNVMVDASGRAMLMDFGLAKPVPGSPGLGEVTASGALMGTPYSMSPEQASGQAATLGPPSDVFSLGVLLYRMTTDALPFDGEGMQVLLSILAQDPVSPSKRNPRVHRDVETITLRCLEKDPRRRYRDGTELAAELRRWLDGEPILSRPIGWTERTVRRASKHRAAVILGALTIMLALAVFNAWNQLRMKSELADRAKRDKQAAEDREKVQKEAVRLLEEARPAITSARRLLHDREARYDALVTRVSAAQRMIERAIRMCPDLPLGYLLLGESWEALGWPDRAEDCYEEALRRDTRFGPARYRLGRIFLGRAFLVTIRASEREIELGRGEAKQWAERARREIDAALSAAEGIQSALERDFARAMAAYAAGSRAEAASLCEAALTAHPGEDGREELLWLLAISRIETAPLSTLDDAITIRPNFPLARLTRAMLRQRLGDPKGALMDLDVAVEWSPRLVQAFLNRGNLRARMSDVAGALDDFEHALAVTTESAQLRLSLGVANFEAGDRARAVRELERALELAPADWEDREAARRLLDRARKGE